MISTVLVLATVLASSDKAPRPAILERIEKLLPRGWTLQTKSLPQGVAGVALGPVTKSGRAVVMLSVLEDGATEEELADRDAREWVTREVEASLAVAEVEAMAGVPGAAEFAAVATPAGTEERSVRYLVASGKPSYLLTVVAPKSTFETTYRQVVDIATRLRRSTAKE
jgi:hypothetical protein